jgi:hypothetical protein
LTTVVYGDITPLTRKEFVLNILWIFTGMLFFSFMISKITGALNKLDVRSGIILQRYEDLEMIIVGKNVPDKIVTQIKKRMHSKYATNFLKEKTAFEVLQGIDRKDRLEMAKCIYNGAVMSIRLF